jgi:hypothetical protein
MFRLRLTYLKRHGDDISTHEMETTVYGDWPDSKSGIMETYAESWHSEVEEYERAILEVELL